MTIIRPTILDVSRAVAELDHVALSPSESKEATRRVAKNLGYMFARLSWGAQSKVTTADVRAGMISHGASSMTCERHARTIARMIRADFSL